MTATQESEHSRREQGETDMKCEILQGNRIGRWLCRHERHKWFEGIFFGKSLVFYTRTCLRCDLFQIQKAGPAGNNEWVLEKEAFKGKVGDWERKEFQDAKPENKQEVLPL